MTSSEHKTNLPCNAVNDMCTERWTYINGTNNSYSVSNLGAIRSNSRVIKYKNGIFKPVRERLLKPYTTSRGYILVQLGRRSTVSVHRLVATAFIPNPDNKPCVNHIDGNPSNNKVDNLEWVTYSENEYHSYSKLGKKPNSPWIGKKGKHCINSKKVGEFKNGSLIRLFHSAGEASKYFGISSSENFRNFLKGHLKYRKILNEVRYLTQNEIKDLGTEGNEVVVIEYSM